MSSADVVDDQAIVAHSSFVGADSSTADDVSSSVVDERSKNFTPTENLSLKNDMKLNHNRQILLSNGGGGGGGGVGSGDLNHNSHNDDDDDNDHESQASTSESMQTNSLNGKQTSSSSDGKNISSTMVNTLTHAVVDRRPGDVVDEENQENDTDFTLHQKALAHYYAKMGRGRNIDDWRQENSTSPTPPSRERSVSDVILKSSTNDNSFNESTSANNGVGVDKRTGQKISPSSHHDDRHNNHHHHHQHQSRQSSSSPMAAAAAAAAVGASFPPPHVVGSSPFFANPFVAPFSAHLPQAQMVAGDDGSVNSSGIFNGMDSSNVRMNPYSGGFYISPQYYQELFQQYMRAVNAAGHTVGVSPASEQGEVVFDDTEECLNDIQQRLRSSTEPTNVQTATDVSPVSTMYRRSSSADNGTGAGNCGVVHRSEQSAFDDVSKKATGDQPSENFSKEFVGKRLAEQIDANLFANELVKKVNFVW